MRRGMGPDNVPDPRVLRTTIFSDYGKRRLYWGVGDIVPTTERWGEGAGACSRTWRD